MSKFKKGYIETIQKKFTQSAREDSLSKYETYITRAINRRSQLVATVLLFKLKSIFYAFFMWQYQGQNSDFWIETAVVNGAGTVGAIQ